MLDTEGAAHSGPRLTRQSLRVNPGVMNLQNVSTEQLRRAVQIKEEIESLEGQLSALLGGNGVSGRGPGRLGRRRRMSAAGRARIAAAARARWAKVRGGNAITRELTAKRRTMSTAARARIAAAQRARWARVRAGK